MANETQNLVLQWITLVLAVILVVGSFTWFAVPIIDCPTCPTCPSIDAPEVNLTSVEDRLTDIEANLNEEDDWKDEAKALATEEWEDRNYKDLFKWMSDPNGGNLSIDDRDDIEKVVIKKETVEIIGDVDDKDAEVTQELKVYYEDEEGDDKKEYITVETTIEDAEVDIQDFEFT